MCNLFWHYLLPKPICMQKIKFFCCLLISSASLQLTAQTTYPVNDVANPKEGCYAFTNATIVKDAQTTLQNATLVIRQGKIESVSIGVLVPKDAVVVDCSGKYIYPSLIDAFTAYGIPEVQRATPAGGGFGNRQSIFTSTKRRLQLE